VDVQQTSHRRRQKAQDTLRTANGREATTPRFGIIGMGHVGSALAAALGGRVDLVCYDRTDARPYPADDLAACAVVAICVDTPSNADGSCDLSNVIAAVEQVPNDRIWLRSTVAPGTTDELVARTGKHICHSPEYYGETPYPSLVWRNEPGDVPFLVVGGAPEARRELLDVIVPVFGPEKTYFQCPALEAELVKYMENAFLATKVTFVNEFAQICRRLGADWHLVREGWLLDPRVGRSHSAVFEPDGGFDGRCLPKDLQAIINAARAGGYEAELLAEVARSNERIRAANGVRASEGSPAQLAGS
jgi:UDPglucose 6-dehydrogenase